jgi:hypothetical protein
LCDLTGIGIMPVRLDECEKRRVGEEIEPGGRPKAPGRLALLQRFVNSYNHDFPVEWDRIGTADKAQAWLEQTRLLAPGERPARLSSPSRSTTRGELRSNPPVAASTARWRHCSASFTRRR